MLVLASILARCLSAAWVPVEPVSDFRHYYDFAAGFVGSGTLGYRGRLFISQGMAYPLFPGYVFRVFGVGVMQAQVAILVLPVLTLVVFARCTARRGWRPSLSALAMGVLALDRGAVSYPAVLGTETLSMLAVLALDAIDRRRPRPEGHGWARPRPCS